MKTETVLVKLKTISAGVPLTRHFDTGVICNSNAFLTLHLAHLAKFAELYRITIQLLHCERKCWTELHVANSSHGFSLQNHIVILEVLKIKLINWLTS